MNIGMQALQACKHRGSSACVDPPRHHQGRHVLHKVGARRQDVRQAQHGPVAGPVGAAGGGHGRRGVGDEGLEGAVVARCEPDRRVHTCDVQEAGLRAGPGTLTDRPLCMK